MHERKSANVFPALILTLSTLSFSYMHTFSNIELTLTNSTYFELTKGFNLIPKRHTYRPNDLRLFCIPTISLSI